MLCNDQLLYHNNLVLSQKPRVCTQLGQPPKQIDTPSVKVVITLVNLYTQINDVRTKKHISFGCTF